MRRFILLVLAVASVYSATFFLLLRVSDTSELSTHFVEVVKKSDSEWDAIRVKKRPAAWVTLGELSPAAVSAILISEDANFWGHNGFDWQETFEAFKTNLARGRFARGGSTISQQVVKNVYLSNRKTIARKVSELVLALRMERQVSKKKILEIYLNIAEFGPGLFGVRSAAYTYFKKHPSQLTAKEGAFLAMLLPSPKKYSVSFRNRELTPYARSTVNRILRKLYAAKRLSEEELRAEIQRPLSFEDSPVVMPAGAESEEGPVDEEVTEEVIEDPEPESVDEEEYDTLEPEDSEAERPYSNTNTASIDL